MTDCEACDTGGKCRPEPKPKPPIFCEKCKARLNQKTPERCPECLEPTKRNNRQCVDCGATQDLVRTPGGVWVCRDCWLGELFQDDSE